MISSLTVSFLEMYWSWFECCCRDLGLSLGWHCLVNIMSVTVNYLGIWSRLKLIRNGSRRPPIHCARSSRCRCGELNRATPTVLCAMLSCCRSIFPDGCCGCMWRGHAPTTLPCMLLFRRGFSESWRCWARR